MQSSFVEKMAERVRLRAGEVGFKQASLAAALGVSTSSVGNYWNGKRAWPTEQLPDLAAALCTNVDGLLTGREDNSLDATGRRFTQRLRQALAPADDDLVELQEIDLAYGLGNTFSDGPVEVETHRFPRAWLERITTTPAAMLTLARGKGDSMQPTIQDGDMVIIDRSQRTVREQDALWALTIGDFAMIKRIRGRGERVTILSDNDRVPADEVHHEEVNVVGRVIFIGRRV